MPRNPISILYEDNHSIVVHKPAGMLTQGDATGDVSIMDEVKEYLKTTYHKPGNVFLGLVHRLDRPVEGVVVFGKTSKGAARLSEQFRAHSVRKIYQAVVHGALTQQTGALKHYILKNKATNVVSVFEAAQVGAFDAKLRYRVLQSNGRYSFLEIELDTGRPHQIRAQLAHIGHPIVGDLKYGSPEKPRDGAIALAAVRLTFTLPTQAKEKTVAIATPLWWQEFVVF